MHPAHEPDFLHLYIRTDSLEIILVDYDLTL